VPVAVDRFFSPWFDKGTQWSRLEEVASCSTDGAEVACPRLARRSKGQAMNGE